MQVRRAREEDLSAIRALYQQLHPEDPPVEATNFDRILDSEHFVLLVLEAGKRVVSTCYLNLVPNLTRSGRPYAVIENVVTDQALRGQGYGSALLGHALKEAWRAGCYKAMLMTGSKRPETHRFYQRAGFDGDDKTGYVARPG